MSDPFLKDSWPIDFFVRCEVPLVEECSRVLRLVSFRPTLEGNLLNTLGTRSSSGFLCLFEVSACFLRRRYSKSCLVANASVFATSNALANQRSPYRNKTQKMVHAQTLAATRDSDSSRDRFCYSNERLFCCRRNHCCHAGLCSSFFPCLILRLTFWWLLVPKSL